MKKTLSSAAADERRAYYKLWREKNKDRVKKYNDTYWERKAEKAKEGD